MLHSGETESRIYSAEIFPCIRSVPWFKLFAMKRSKTQWKRLLKLHELIKDEQFPNCSSFAKEWEVSTKTVQRDIDFLQYQLGAPIEYDALKRGYYYTDPFFMLPSIPMSEGELLALMIGTQALAAYRGTPVSKQLESVLGKLSDVLPDEISINPSELFANFSFSAPPSIPVNPQIWKSVVKGLVSRQQMEVTYNGKSSRIHPLHMANLQGAWYLFVRFHDYDNFRQISVARIEKARLLKKPVDASGFDPQDFLANTLYRFAGDNQPFTVKLVFDAEVADSMLEQLWHPDQKTRELKDGRVELEFSAKGEIEVKRWIMAWGRYCTVKSPEWVKRMIADEVEAMVNRAKSD